VSSLFIRDIPNSVRVSSGFLLRSCFIASDAYYFTNSADFIALLIEWNVKAYRTTRLGLMPLHSLQSASYFVNLSFILKPGQYPNWPYIPWNKNHNVETGFFRLFDLTPTCFGRCQCNEVGVEVRLRTGRIGVPIPVGKRDFSFLQIAQTVSETHPASCSVDTGVNSRGIKRRIREAYHSPPSNSLHAADHGSSCMK
jgi:hypothetical protein